MMLPGCACIPGTGKLLSSTNNASPFWAAFSVLLGLFALGMSITIVNVALPYVQGSFAMSDSDVQWLSTGFLASTTGALLAAPWGIARFGTRRVYLAILVTFIAASLLGSLAQSGMMVIVARCFQGAMTGMIRPVALGVLYQTFKPQQRGLASAIYASFLGMPLAVAPGIGGYLVDHMSWRQTFTFTIPFCLLAIVLALLYLPRHDASGGRATSHPPFDWLGLVVLFIALFTTLAGLAQGQRLGWDHFFVLGCLAAGLAAACGFVLWELTNTAPLLDLRCLGNLGFTSAFVAIFGYGAGFYGAMYLIPQLAQAIQGQSPTTSGLMLLPALIGFALLPAATGGLSDRFPTAFFSVSGLVLFAGCTGILALADRHTSFAVLLLASLLLGVGCSLFMGPIFTGAMYALPPRFIGYGPGAINFSLQFGGALGTNALLILQDRRSFFHSDHLTPGLRPDNPLGLAALQHLEGMLSAAGTSPAVVSAGASYTLGHMVWLQSATKGYHDGFMVVTIMLLLAIVPAIITSIKGR